MSLFKIMCVHQSHISLFFSNFSFSKVTEHERLWLILPIFF